MITTSWTRDPDACRKARKTISFEIINDSRRALFAHRENNSPDVVAGT